MRREKTDEEVDVVGGFACSNCKCEKFKQKGMYEVFEEVSLVKGSLGEINIISHKLDVSLDGMEYINEYECLNCKKTFTVRRCYGVDVVKEM